MSLLIFQASWTCVAKAYIRVISAAKKNPTTEAYSIAIAEQELDVICNAMRIMGAFFPIAGESIHSSDSSQIPILIPTPRGACEKSRTRACKDSTISLIDSGRCCFDSNGADDRYLNRFNWTSLCVDASVSWYRCLFVSGNISLRTSRHLSSRSLPCISRQMYL